MVIEYDSLYHNMQVVGNVPNGVVAKYYYNNVYDETNTGVKEVGAYEVKCVLTGQGYVTKTLTSTIKIKATEEELFTVRHNGTIYFQNNLDGNRLYKTTTSGVVKVSNDQANYFATDGQNLYYYSIGLLTKNIKVIDGSATVSTLYKSVNANYLVCDGEYLYYAINNSLINTDQNGIYKISVTPTDSDGSTASATKVCSYKAKDLVIYGNYIYFVNASENDKIYKIDKTAVNGTPELVVDKKCSDLTIDNGVLYFTTHTLTDSSIYKYSISSSLLTKLCQDNGKYLTVIDDYVYYVNQDLLTSNLFGKGIYKVSVNGALSGTKIIESEDNSNGYSSLSTDGTYLYYYKLNDKRLYKYNVNNNSEIDLMADFVVDNTVTPIGFEKTAIHDGEIYFTNPIDNGSLYKYNPTTKQSFKVLDDCVAGVWFNDGYMYYSTYIVTNYALWKMDLTTFESVKISSDRCDSLIFDNESDKIYYVNIGVTAKNICVMNFDGTENQVLIEDCYMLSLSINDGKLYFNSDPAIGYKKLKTYDLTTGVIETIETSDKFVVYNDLIYFYDHNAEKLYKYDGTDKTPVLSDVDIREMICHNGFIYFSGVSGNYVGTYKLDLSNDTPTRLCSNKGSGFTVVGETLYFLEGTVSYGTLATMTMPTIANGNGNLYSVSINGGDLTKLT